MRVLVACERSGRVRDAFIAMGFDAISCDLVPTDKPGPHYQGNVLDIIDDGFDLMIAHPPCTFLTNAAEWAYKDEQTKNIKPGTLIGAERREARNDAVEFVRRLSSANIKRKAVENPVGVLSRRWRDPDQYIQPYDFGEDASKKTCLWLENLPRLKPAKFIEPCYVCRCGFVFAFDLGKFGCPDCLGKSGPALPRWGNQTDSGQNKLPPGPDRERLRSLTYQGWADAFAAQWGPVIAGRAVA